MVTHIVVFARVILCSSIYRELTKHIPISYEVCNISVENVPLVLQKCSFGSSVLCTPQSSSSGKRTAWWAGYAHAETLSVAKKTAQSLPGRT